MKNKFTVSVCFKEVPIQEYEWDNLTIISGLRVIRVSSNVLKNILTYSGSINTKEKILLLSDCKLSIVLKLDNDNKIIKRSFLSYSEDEIICEYACSLKESKIDYHITNKKLIYKTSLIEEEQVKNYLIKTIKNSKDEYKNKYLYYLYFDNIDNYSKERLINSIKNDDNYSYEKLYSFLEAK